MMVILPNRDVNAEDVAQQALNPAAFPTLVRGMAPKYGVMELPRFRIGTVPALVAFVSSSSSPNVVSCCRQTQPRTCTSEICCPRWASSRSCGPRYRVRVLVKQWLQHNKATACMWFLLCKRCVGQPQQRE